MKLGIIITTTNAETAWNALRLAVFARRQGDEVAVFLLASGVDVESLETPRFAIRALLEELTELGGRLLACGTCIKLRHAEEQAPCPLSTMEDLHRLVVESERVLTF